jgi:AcrR family transcriptional regulator
VGRTKTIDDAKLLRIAREVFGEQGHTATTRDVANAAGISQGVLFQRFGSKEDLFLRAMTPELPDLEALLGSYPPRSAKADLVQIADRLAEFFGTLLPTLLHVLAHPDLSPARLRKWHTQLPFAPILHALTARIHRMQLDGLIRKVNAEAAARSLMSAVHTTAFLDTMLEGSDHAHGHGAHGGGNLHVIVDVLWSGLAPD